MVRGGKYSISTSILQYFPVEVLHTYIHHIPEHILSITEKRKKKLWKNNLIRFRLWTLTSPGLSSTRPSLLLVSSGMLFREVTAYWRRRRKKF